MTLPFPQRQPGFPHVRLFLCLGLDGGRHRPRRYTWLLPSGGADVPGHRHPNQLRRDLAAGHDHWPGAHHQVHLPRQAPVCPLDLIAETVRCNPDITTFHVRPSVADYSSLLESLSTPCLATTPGSTATTWLPTLWMPCCAAHQAPLRFHEVQARHFRQGRLVQGGSQEEVVPL